MSAAKELPFSLVLRADVGAGKAALREVQGGLDAVMGAAGRAAGAVLQSDSSLSGLSATGLRASTALSGVTTASDDLTRGISAQAAEVVAANREHRAWQATLDQLRARFNPLFAASQAYERELQDIAEAERIGALSALEAAGARERASAIIAPINKGLADNARLARGAAAANAYYFAQFNDVAMMAALGQNPMMLALQQGPQINQMIQQQGGLRAALPGLVGGLTAMLNPLSLATIGIIAFGAAGVQWLMSLQGETKTYEDTLEDLNETLDRMKGRFDLLGNSRLEERFGSLSGLVRALNADMLDLDRAAELKTLKATVEGFLKDDIEPGFGQQFWQFMGGSLSGLGNPNILTEDTLKGANLARLGAGIGGAEFSARQDEIVKLAGAGEVEQVIARVVDLQKALAGDGPFTEMDEKLQAHLVTLSEWAQRTAEIEAFWNGSARAERITRETDDLVTASRQRAEIAQAELVFGQNSVQVEAVRNRHAREALALRLEELGVAAESETAARALTALTEEQAALARLRADEEARAGRRLITDLTNQAALSAEALRFGQDSTQVEALRAQQAREALRTRLKEQNVAEALIDQALALLQLDQDRVKALREADRARETGNMLTTLREEAAIGKAIVRHGRDSRQVKELQIEAERRQFALQLDRMNLTREQTREFILQWDVARGLAAADPFGDLGAARELLKTQAERTESLRLELALVGQSEARRSRLLALHRAELDIRRRGLDTSSQAAEAIRAGAIEEDALKRRIEGLADAWGRVDDAAGSAIDGMVDALTGGDLGGALDQIGDEILGFFTELSLKNPLKNLILGQDLPTIHDLGGIGGIFNRLTGREAQSPELRLSTMNAASMAVTTPLVTLNAGSITGLPTAFGGASALTGDLSGSGDVQSQVWNFFRGKGLASHQVAAIMGNVSAESGFNPLAVGDGGFAHGLFQHNDRAPALFDFIGGRGNLGDVQKQLEFAWHELLTSENGVLRRLQSAPDLYSATEAFVGFERPSGWSRANPTAAHGWDRRLGSAEAAMEKFGRTAESAQDQLGQLGTGAAVLGGGLEGFGASLSGLIQGLGAKHGLGGVAAGSLLTGLGKIIGLPGFSYGGPTGGSDPTRVAGLVHEEEFVFDAAATRRIGVQNLEAIRRGVMKGYARGGHVTSAAQPIPAFPGQSRQVEPGGTRERAVFEINMSGTGTAEVREGVHQAISTAFDVFTRDMLPDLVRKIVDDRWSS